MAPGEHIGGTSCSACAWRTEIAKIWPISMLRTKPVPLIQKALFGAGTELLLLSHLKKLEQAPGDACCPMRKSGEIMLGKAIKRVPRPSLLAFSRAFQ